MWKIYFPGVLIVLICAKVIFAKDFTREECEEMGGSYCPGKKVKDCYLCLEEEVTTYQEAVDLCAKKGAKIPYLSMTDYSNFLNCTDFPWDYPFTMFLQNSLPTSDKCISATFIDVVKFSTFTSCSLTNLKSKAKVVCEIPF